MNTTKATLVQAMEAYFGQDVKRINHAHRVTEYAEELLKQEGGDDSVVIAAGLLHDIGIKVAEKKYGSTSGKYQEKEGPPIARGILSGMGFPPEQIEEVCQIIAHHHSPGKVNTKNFNLFDKALLSMARSIGGLFLLVKGYFTSKSRGWRCGWER